MKDRLRRVARKLRTRLARKALVLMYHRVAEPGCDPFALSVTPRHFAEHLEVLRRHARPLRLRDLADRLQAGSVPRRSVVVTFDDGYSDNFYNARPWLERYDIPATVFVATGYLEQDREFWWDELERLLEPGTLPDELCLRVNGSSHRWQLGEAARLDEAACERRRDWRFEQEPPTARHALHNSLWRLAQLLPEDERRGMLDEVLAWSGASPASRPEYRTLSPRELLALTEGGLVEAGAHTVTHPILCGLPAQSQRSETSGSKLRLEELTGRPVSTFTYPYGAWSEESVSVVREAGFACACAAEGGAVQGDADPFLLPRVQVLDQSGEAFGRQLEAWFDGAEGACQ